MNEQFLTRTYSDLERQDADRRAQLDALTRPGKCRLCGARTQPDDEGRQRTVCPDCGGAKKQRQLEEQDRAEQRARNRTTALLRLARITTTPNTEVTMEAKKCTKCERKLHANNTSGICTECQKTHPGAAREARKHSVSGTGSSVKKQFRTLTEALGQDPDELIERFMSGWIDNLRNSVRLDG